MALVLGVTGGIGTGKSTALAMLGKLGAEMMSADDIAREVLAKGTPAFHEVVEHFGTGIVAADGEIDRVALAGTIFRDPEARAALNDITHPRIIGLMRERIESFRATHGCRNALLAIEIPLLVECGLDDMVDQVLLIAAEQDTQVGRLTRRTGIDREEAARRVASQLPIRDKAGHADYVLWNDGTIDDLERQVACVWRELRAQDCLASS